MGIFILPVLIRSLMLMGIYMALLTVYSAMVGGLPTLDNVCTLHVHAWDDLLSWARHMAQQYGQGAFNGALLQGSQSGQEGSAVLSWDQCMTSWGQQKVGVYPLIGIQALMGLGWIAKGAWIHLIRLINTTTPMYVFEQKLRMFGLSAQVFFFTLLQLLLCAYAYAKIVLGVVKVQALQGASSAILSVAASYPLPVLFCVSMWLLQWMLLRWYKKNSYWNTPYGSIR